MTLICDHTNIAYIYLLCYEFAVNFKIQIYKYKDIKQHK